MSFCNRKFGWIIGFSFVTVILTCSIVFMVFLRHAFFCKLDSSIVASLLDERISDLGRGLGFHEDELQSQTSRSKLLLTWRNDRIDNGPDIYTLTAYIELKRINVAENCYKKIEGFENCTNIVYYASSVVLYSLLIQGPLLLFCCWKLFGNVCWGSSGLRTRRGLQETYSYYVTAQRRRTRTYTGTEASDNYSTVNGSDIYGTNSRLNSTLSINCSRTAINTSTNKRQKRKSTGIIFAQCFKHVDCEEEQVHVKIPSVRPRSTFKKDVDGTLSRENVMSLVEMMGSVGILFFHTDSVGTVLRLGSHFVITAWHVIRSIVLPGSRPFQNTNIDVSLLNSPYVYVDFAPCCRQSPESMHFRLEPTIVFKDEILDIAIVPLKQEDSKIFPKPFLKMADVSNLNNDGKKVPCVHVIGKHPSKDLVVADTGCKLITRNDKRVKEAKKWMQSHMKGLKKIAIEKNENPNDVDTAYFDVSDTGRRLIFDTFLEFGGSGAAAISFLPDGPALVAILIHGLPPNYWYSIGSHKFPDYMRMEVGCTLKAVYESQQWNGKEDLRAALFCYRPPPENMDTS